MKVRSWTDGTVGRLELDRPAALNALDLDMIRGLREALDRWRSDDDVAEVVITGAGGRAFCSGGDVRAAREAVLAGRAELADTFFAEEYALNGAIAELPKPYVAVIDGVAMGGGLGVSIHGSARVVTERAALAMPETALGFTPDVGSTYFLSHLDGDPAGAVGRYLALTGARIGAADALALGLATHFVPANAVDALLDDAGAEGTAAALARHAADPAEAGEPSLAPYRDRIEATFSAGTVTEILERLDDAGDDWAAGTAAALRIMCPTSLVVALELLKAGAASTLGQCLENELRAAVWLIARPDFAEGVRAVLVDKDRKASWSPARVDEVDAEQIRALLVPAPAAG
ncbi:enoyl-CoA hydratase [Georgenia soli]|uniref:3-hydroxyisobutyryl-CoA hydrolase n=1 Tax=Georgenia soli TaxID=638953 RepID=A0A2A9EM89_9MICO|nr:enoyl-CoA hydratase/isomerase family protein [Georgenia soli]PFG39726.1 enoyl-CoA hydratase [Georgenia soli]